MTSGAEVKVHKASEDRVTRGRAGVAIDRVQSVGLVRRPDSALLLRMDEGLADLGVGRVQVWIWIL